MRMIRMTPTAAESVLQELDALIARRSILEHAFYRAWSAGRLTRDHLAAYARVYYPHVAAFPGYLEKTAAGAGDPAVADELAANLREERSEPAPHAELWLRFAAGVGAEPAAVAAAAPEPETRAAVATFERLCSRSAAAGLAALYAYESQQPEVSRQKEDGLRGHYEVNEVDALAYFTVHAEADLRHREGERRALGRCLASGASRNDVLEAAEQALDAYWGLLDGVCRVTGVPRDC